MKNTIYIIFIICLVQTCCKNLKKTEVKEPIQQQKSELKPNIIYILADDLGYGDLSCYGQKLFSTPNIDKLAKEGLLFTQHYAGSPVCAPSRATLMTGEHTGHVPIRGNKELNMGQKPLPKEYYTIAELLKEHGYATGAFGKWGLGTSGSEGDPMHQGFDAFFGFHDQKLAHHYYPYYLWNNEEVFILSENEGLKKGQYAPNLIHERAISFINEHKDTPFFLYYPTIIPHAELFAPEDYMNRFIGKFEPETPYLGVDEGEDYKKGQYGSQKYPHAAFAAMVTLLDDQVGDIMKKIKALGLEDNTIFIFTSDNGPHLEAGADPDYFDSNGVLKGYKRDLFEGGIRVPMIVKWKGNIEPATQTDLISSFWDIMPTLADLLGVKLQNNYDGISLLPTLLKKGSQIQHEYLYWEFHELGGRQALRKDQWKLIKYNVSKGGNYQLYDLSKDISETMDLANEMPEKVNELSAILESARTESNDFKFGK